MKIVYFALVISLAFSSISFASPTLFKGQDNQGKFCSLEILESMNAVRTSYSGAMLFELTALPADSRIFVGSRSLVTASTRMDFEVTYDFSRKSFTYAETRVNVRTGEIFSDLYRECQLARE